MFDVKSHLTFDMISDTTSSSTAYNINKDMSNIPEVKGTQNYTIKVALKGTPKCTPNSYLWPPKPILK